MSDISPAVEWLEVDVSSEDVVLSRACRAVTIGTGGILNAVPGNSNSGDAVATASLPAGTYAMRVKEIKTAVTTASDITVWW